MDFQEEERKIFDIYNEHSIENQYKRANAKDKFIIFILPVIFTIMSICLFVFGIIKNNILNLVAIFLLLVIFYIYNKTYDNYIKRKYYLHGTKIKDMYFNIFKKNLDVHDINNSKKVKFYIDILELEKVSTSNIKTGFLEYISLLYIPGLMIYFNSLFEKEETIAYLTIGLFSIPVFIFLFKVLFINRKQIKYDTLLHFLKRRNIELINE